MEKSIFIPKELLCLKQPFASLSAMDVPRIRNLPVSLTNRHLVKESLLQFAEAFAQ